MKTWRPCSVVTCAITMACTGVLPSTENQPLEAVRVALPSDGLWIGRSDAKVTVVEFGTALCPVCKRFARREYARYVAPSVAEGRVRYLFVDVSGFGVAGVSAALVGCLASEVNVIEARRFVGDSVYGKPVQPTVAQAVDAVARKTGSTTEAVRDCVREYSKRAYFREGRQLARRLAVVGTPSFVVGTAVRSSIIEGLPMIGLDRPDSLKILIREIARMHP